MSRYIDADELKRNHMFYHEADNRSYAEERDIDETPTVDAVPVVHGHWEIVPNGENTDGYYKMRCSVCGEILWSIQSEELYCCKCGAKMDECADGERRSE